MMVAVFDRIENRVRNGENAGKQHFLLFPQCFPKLSTSGLLILYLREMKIMLYYVLFQQCFQKNFFLGSLKFGIVW